VRVKVNVSAKGLLVSVLVFIVHKYQPYRYFDVSRPRAVSSAGGSVGV